VEKKLACAVAWLIYGQAEMTLIRLVSAEAGLVTSAVSGSGIRNKDGQHCWPRRRGSQQHSDTCD